MAGIGFQLRKLSRQDTLSSVVAAVGHAAVIAAGPWLFTIMSLAAITLSTERVAGLETLAAFRIVIIYAFAISLVVEKVEFVCQLRIRHHSPKRSADSRGRAPAGKRF